MNLLCSGLASCWLSTCLLSTCGVVIAGWWLISSWKAPVGIPEHLGADCAASARHPGSDCSTPRVHEGKLLILGVRGHSNTGCLEHGAVSIPGGLGNAAGRLLCLLLGQGPGLGHLARCLPSSAMSSQVPSCTNQLQDAGQGAQAVPELMG